MRLSYCDVCFTMQLQKRQKIRDEQLEAEKKEEKECLELCFQFDQYGTPADAAPSAGSLPADAAPSSSTDVNSGH